MLRAAVWPWRCGHDPMLDPDILFRLRIGPARDVAGGKDAGRAGFEIRIDGDATIDRQSRLFGQSEARPHADADHDQIGLQRAAALQRGALALDRGDGVAEMEDHAVLLMQRAHEVAHLRAEDTLHRPLLGRHDMNLDVAGAQRRRGLQPDEARADHDRPLRALALAMMARLSASERSVWTCFSPAPGIGKRTGSAPVASSRRS